MNDKRVLVDSCYEMQSPGPLLIFFMLIILCTFLGMGMKKALLKCYPLPAAAEISYRVI